MIWTGNSGMRSKNNVLWSKLNKIKNSNGYIVIEYKFWHSNTPANYHLVNYNLISNNKNDASFRKTYIPTWFDMKFI